MRAVQIFENSALACGAESLDSILLALHHASALVVLDDVDTLTSVDLVPLHAVPTQVLNALDGVGLVANSHLI